MVKKKKQKEWYKTWWGIISLVIIGLIILGILFPSSNSKTNVNTSKEEIKELILTQELKDDICYEMDTYIEYCYSQGNSLDECASQTLEKVMRIYGITAEQFLEVNDYCYS